MPNTPQTYFASLPSSRINNSRAIARGIYSKAQAEGKSIGYWSDKFAELSQIQPADDRTGADYGNEFIDNEE